MAESEEELKSFLMKVKEESQKAGLKLNIQKSKVMASGPITSWQIDGGKNGKSGRFYFLGFPNHCRWWHEIKSHEIKRCLLLGRKAMTNPDSILKAESLFANKDLYSQSYGFSSGHAWMWELVHKGSWMPKNWCFRTVVLEKALESPLDSKEIKPFHPKGNQPWIFIRKTDAKAEAPIFWPPDAKSPLTGKDPDAG